MTTTTYEQRVMSFQKSSMRDVLRHVGVLRLAGELLRRFDKVLVLGGLVLVVVLAVAHVPAAQASDDTASVLQSKCELLSDASQTHYWYECDKSVVDSLR